MGWPYKSVYNYITFQMGWPYKECIQLHCIQHSSNVLYDAIKIQYYLPIITWGQSWSYGSWIYKLHMQSMPITTNIVSSNPSQVRCTGYNIM